MGIEVTVLKALACCTLLWMILEASDYSRHMHIESLADTKGGEKPAADKPGKVTEQMIKNRCTGKGCEEKKTGAMHVGMVLQLLRIWTTGVQLLQR